MSPEAAGRNRRKLTVRSVYQCLYESKVGCTKAELAGKLNFSLPTIYQCLTELMGKGLIRYAGELQSTGGRRPQRLQVVADARVAVGISLMEDRIRMVVTDLYLKELHYRNVPHRLQLQSDALALFLAENLEQLLPIRRDDAGNGNSYAQEPFPVRAAVDQKLVQALCQKDCELI